MSDRKKQEPPASFAYKYNESIMRQALAAKLTSPLPEHRTLAYTVKAPIGYITPQALVFDLVSDEPKTACIQSIEQVFTDLNDLYKDNPEELQQLLDREKILLPVAEACKILGIFPRMHWVTLCYEPKKNRATLIDSRPWYASFLYNKKTMIASLKTGVASLFGEETAQKMRFKTRYQGVQHNDIHCGAWTARNVIDLATGEASLEKQLKKYRSGDESLVMKSNCPPGKKLIPRPLSWFSRVLVYLGLATQEYNLLDGPSTPFNSSKLPSPNSSGHTTPRQCSPQKKSSPASRRSSRIFNDTEVIEDYVNDQNATQTPLQKK